MAVGGCWWLMVAVGRRQAPSRRAERRVCVGRVSVIGKRPQQPLAGITRRRTNLRSRTKTASRSTTTTSTTTTTTRQLHRPPRPPPPAEHTNSQVSSPSAPRTVAASVFGSSGESSYGASGGAHYVGSFACLLERSLVCPRTARAELRKDDRQRVWLFGRRTSSSSCWWWSSSS